MKSLFTNKKLLISLAIVPVIGAAAFISAEPKSTEVNATTTPTLEESIEPKLSAQESLDTKPHKEDILDQVTTKDTIASVTKKVSTDQVTHKVVHQTTNNPVPDTQKSAIDNRLSKWDVQILDDDNETMSSLTLNVTKISYTDIEGESCYISKYGKRIDCEVGFYGRAVNDDMYRIHFTSSYDQSKGQATITFKDNSLLWKLNSFPENSLGVMYPDNAILTKDNDNNHTDKDVQKQAYVIISEKAAIYSKPTEKNKTKAYFIQGDVVAALQQKEGWIAISYKKDTKTGWLKINDVAEQLHE